MKYHLPLLLGAVITFMIGINGQLSAQIGNYATSVVVHAVGVLGVCLILFFKKERMPSLKNIPYYWFLGGLFGAITVVFNNIGFHVFGATLTLALGLLGQMVFSVAIDHYGLFGMTPVRMTRKQILPLIFIITGITFMALS